MKRLCSISVAAAIAIFAVQAQSPTPAAPAAAAANPESVPVAIKQLQEIKAANQELLQKQDAALQRLDELQKAADEIKIFGKRS
jgi:hypothetical protein